MIRGRSLIKRYNLPLCFRDTQKVAGSNSPFDNDESVLETIFTKRIAENCTIQDPDNDDLKLLPEGIGLDKAKVIYTNSYVPSIPEGSDRLPAIFYISNAYYTLDPTYPSEVGGWYKVISSRQWLNNVINHYECLVVRVDTVDNKFPDTTLFDASVTTREQFLDSTLWEGLWLS